MKKQCLIYRVDRIGDFICTIPALYLTRLLLPQHHITLIILPSLKDIADCLSCIDTTLIYDENNPFPIKNPDYCIAFNPPTPQIYDALKNNTVAHLLGEWRAVPFLEYPICQMYNKYTRTKLHAQRLFGANSNETIKAISYLQSINPTLYKKYYLQSLPTKPLEVPAIYTEMITTFLAPYKNKTLLCISPCKEGESKTVPDALYPHIIDRIQEQFPEIVVILSVSAGDTPRAKSIQENIKDPKKCLIYSSVKSLLEVVALIDACDIFIGSSSGPGHIAGLLGKKIIAFYPFDKGHSPNRWGIYNTKHTVRYILSKKNIDNLPQNHPERFQEKHIQELLKYMKELLSS